MGRVRHVRSGGEVQVLTPAEMVSVDGFDQETKTIYEFYGCHFHGYPRCLPRNRDVRRNCHKDRTVNVVYVATEREAAMLRQAGYQVSEKWECDFNQDKKTDPQLKSFLQDLEMVAPLRTEGCFLLGFVQRQPLFMPKQTQRKTSNIATSPLFTHGSINIRNIR